MLSLGEQISGDAVGAGGFIGEGQNLAGAEEAVDADTAGQGLLGQLHVGVAWADKFIDGLDGLRSQRQRGDSRGPAGAIDLGQAQLVIRGQDDIALPVLAWRRADGEPRHTGDLCRDGQHDDAGRIRRLSAGDEETDAGQWREPHA